MRPASNLADLLARAAQESPDRVALVEAAGGRRTTWAELDAEADRVAQGLSGLGLVAGYRVVIALANRTEFVAAYLGALRARLVAVPANPRSTTGEVARMMADSGARVVLADQGTVATVRSAVAGLEDALVGADEELVARTNVPRVVVVAAPTLPGETPYAELVSNDGRVPPTPEDPEALAVLLYTSGTSGRPRAAMLSHRALLANIEQAAAVEPPLIEQEDIVLGVLPLFHVYGLNAVLGQVLRQQARLVLAEGFDVEGTLELVEREAVTVIPVAPPVLAYWRDVDNLDERLASVRVVLSGSAPLAPALVAQFEKQAGVTVHQGYGLTEAAPVVTSTQRSASPKQGSVGAALPGVSIRLVDEAGQTPEGEDPGEIEVKGDNLFSGYWPGGADGPGPDGWWATGDVGFLDPDGDLFLVDRLKELVIVSGFNVYPVEVEEVISELDEVQEAAVIGVDDERTGEAVVAYVKQSPRSGLTADGLADRVREHCASRLARFKQPSVVEVVDELPHTVTGKVAKGMLRATRRRRNLGLLE
ncbi:MAG: class I adenylate-forming enzyme family protein [Nocardioidaceae bacterium]